MEAVVNLLDATGTYSAYDCFQIELCRDDDCNKILRLKGHHVDLCMYITIRTFGVDEESMETALEVCDMLNYLIEILEYFIEVQRDGHNEILALQMVAAMFPEHFKYLAELGYVSPSEEGGEAP